MKRCATHTEISVAGVAVVLDPSGALYLPSERLLVVSDLHLEKGSWYAARGQFLPPYDTRTTLAALSAAVRVFWPRRILSLGDTFHDPDAERRMVPQDCAVLTDLCETCDWIFILGNHDPLPPARFRGEAHERATIGGLTFVHEPEGEGWHVAGHLHPCAVVVRDGRRLRRSCFVTDGERLVMPSLGAFTGGLNVLDPAFTGVFTSSPCVYLRGARKTYGIPSGALRPDGGAGRVFTQRLRSAALPR